MSQKKCNICEEVFNPKDFTPGPAYCWNCYSMDLNDVDVAGHETNDNLEQS